MTKLKNIAGAARTLAVKVRRYISPVFVMMLVASFTLWYIAKLNYTYTTELDIKVTVEGERFEVPCVVEGKGTNLFGYSVYTSRRISIPLENLRYTVVEEPVANIDGAPQGSLEQTVEHSLESAPASASAVRRVVIDPISLRSAISVHFSDIKIISVGAIPEIEVAVQ